MERDRQSQAKSQMLAQLKARGICEEAVLKAMESVPRHAFVSQNLTQAAYEDSALPIAEGQTISQPYMVALMAQALQLNSDSRVLEVGTGSGYAAAVLSLIASHVYTIEYHARLAQEAQLRFQELGYPNISCLTGDGSLGWPEKAPFQAITVAAGGPKVPPVLLDQLAIGGKMIMPIGQSLAMQELMLIEKTKEGLTLQKLGGVRFVPLLGKEGWQREGV